MAKYIQFGASLDYTPPTDVAAGTVVQVGTEYVGVSGNDIAANTKGAFAVVGAVELPLTATMVGGPYAQGTLVGIDIANQEIVPAGTGNQDLPLTEGIALNAPTGRVQLKNGV